MHLVQHQQVFVIQVVAQHHDAVAIAADQEFDRFDGFVARRAVAAAGGHYHVAAHGAQLDVGLLEDGAVIGAEKRRGEDAYHAQRLGRQRAADGRGAEVQLLDGGLHAGHRVRRNRAGAGYRAGRSRHAYAG